MPARRTASRTTSAKLRGGELLQGAEELPVAVRTALTITASRMGSVRARWSRRDGRTSETTVIVRTTSGPSNKFRRSAMTGRARMTRVATRRTRRARASCRAMTTTRVARERGTGGHLPREIDFGFAVRLIAKDHAQRTRSRRVEALHRPSILQEAPAFLLSSLAMHLVLASASPRRPNCSQRRASRV